MKHPALLDEHYYCADEFHRCADDGGVGEALRYNPNLLPPPPGREPPAQPCTTATGHRDASRALAHYLRRWERLKTLHCGACLQQIFSGRCACRGWQMDVINRWRYGLWLEIRLLDPEAARMVAG